MGPLRRLAPYVLGSMLVASCAPRLHDGTVLEGERIPLELHVRQLSGNEALEGGIVEYFCWPEQRDERVLATEIDFGDAAYRPRSIGGGIHRYEHDGWHTIVCRAYGEGVWGIRSVQFGVD